MAQLQITKLSEIGTFVSDIGFVSPLKLEINGYVVLPFILVPKEVKAKALLYIRSEWQSSNEEYADEDFITNHWAGGDVFYVMIDSQTRHFIGCIAIDRKQFYPFISHLFIVPEMRGRHLGTILIRLAVEYGKELGFPNIRLWCVSKLITYYERFGFKVDTSEQFSCNNLAVDNVIMIR